MRLKELDGFSEITIQCHDNPDADALASAFGLYKYFRSRSKAVRMIYSGSLQIRKSNLLLMIRELSIPVQYCPPDVKEFKGLLLTVDCQYGQGNVTKLTADEYAVIDHHNGVSTLPLSEIRSELGSCSTLVWELLSEEGFEVSADTALSTALYYGLMTDTGGFSEISHPLDKDMRDTLWVNEAQIRLFSNSNISLEEMKITGEALLRCRYIKEHDCGIFRSDECDPNILGIISDMALQVAEFSLVTAFGHVSGGYRLSVRSCTKEVMADDFIRFITKDIGSGGGHSFKAGGFISEDKLKESFPGLLPEEYLDQAVERYFDSFTIIHAQSYRPDMSRFSRYVKNRMVLGYIAPSSFLEKNTRIRVRTLEGDTELFVDESFYLMVGFLGEVYPIKKEKFEAGYEQTEEEFTGRMEYVPRIYAGPEGKVYELYEHMKPCASTGKAFIMASELTQAVKLFTEWYDEKYMKGEPGDYMACRADDPNDFYIIRRDIFELTYSPA